MVSFHQHSVLFHLLYSFSCDPVHLTPPFGLYSLHPKLETWGLKSELSEAFIPEALGVSQDAEVCTVLFLVS